MEKEIINSVLAKLDALAVKMGMTVKQIWPWLVKQQYVDAFYSLILFLSFSLFGYISYYFIKRVKWSFDFTSAQGIGIALGIVSGVGIISSLFYFLGQFPDIFNAEYWALKDLLDMIK